MSLGEVNPRDIFGLGPSLDNSVLFPLPFVPVVQGIETYDTQETNRLTSPENLVSHAMKLIANNPSTKLVIQGGGSPAQGSTLIMGEIAEILAWGLSEFAQREKLQIRIGICEWGQACLPIVHSGDPPSDDPIVVREFRTQHVREGAEVYFGTLERWMDDKPRDTIDIWAGTLSLNAGVLVDGKEFGLPRAFGDMEDFSKRRGRFVGKTFEDLWFSIQASPEVDRHNEEKRVAMLAFPAGAQREAYLQTQGITVKKITDVRGLPYGTGVGSIINKKEMEGNIDDASWSLRKEGKLKLPDILDWRFLVQDDLCDPRVRAHVVLRGLNPLVFDSLGIPPEKSAHFYNNSIEPRVVIYRDALYADVKALNPLIEYNPKLYEPYLEEAA